MEKQQEYFTVKAVAERLKVSERTVKNWLASGKLPAFKVGNVVRIDSTELSKFLEKNTTKPE